MTDIRWNRQAFRVAALLAAATCALLGGAAGWYFNKPEEPKVPAADAWYAWFDEHRKTCPECGGPPDHPMCVEAFKKLQDSMREK